ncbi:glycoside hydrolase family 10 protein [Chaetomium fimeti]|uniref:Beta-xylanase n=1 Tax=Chaetomium fimeti TaxID=1854472 RepID=A0AAE0HIH0_9PEZI|nr:glycoside hydrolase family 10 protein [Chaetomium fimeti]
MSRLTRTLLLASSLASGAAAQNGTQGEGLHSLMVAAGKLYFGTAMETNNFDDAAYQAIATNKNEFGMFTPENSQKWEVTEPTQNDFSFTQADSIAERVLSNGQLFRCHTLTWHSQLPPFVANGTWTPETLTAVLTAHITTVMQHYAGQCYAWDVVNEALNEDGSLRSSPFLTTLGEAYIPLSFTIAAQADPSTKLYYNDFNLETTPPKTAAALSLVRAVQSAGAPIHGVGFQAHLNVGQTPSRADLAAILTSFTALGVEVAYTELDIAHVAPALPADEAGNAQQAEDYAAVVGSCLDVEACVGVTVWQFTDRYSWVPSTFPGKGEACLWTEGYEKKVAYERVVGLLREAAVVEGGGGGAGGGAGDGSGSGNGRWGKWVDFFRGKLEYVMFDAYTPRP